MFDIEKMHAYAKELKELMDLTLNIQAYKFVEDESIVPEDAYRPRERGEHMALCQAIALTKREGKTVYIVKEDHWCWNPLIGLGHVECEPGMESFEIVAGALGIADMDAARAFFAKFPKLPANKYKGLLIAPMQDAQFEPDMILINCDNNFQLRFMIWGIKSQTGKMLETSFDAIDSCIHSIVEAYLNQEYRITIPDPGDQERALSDKNEIILSVPPAKLDELMTGCRLIDGRTVGYKGMKLIMKYNFARPPFYNELYRIWGLDESEVWEH
ncbi:MAG: DUF169 domain-containing protein [Lachnospiraceae bacterium]|nr:DUF169 domain-containing protein [Lachnospiraceae bacterium]